MTNPKAPERVWLAWNRVSTDFDDDVEFVVYDVFDEPVGRLPMYRRADTVVSKDIVRELLGLARAFRATLLGIAEHSWDYGRQLECSRIANDDVDPAIARAEEALNGKV